MPKDKNEIKKETTETKSFSYRRGSVALNFSLRTDIKTELADFLELLKIGLVEVQEEMNDRYPH